MLCGLGSIFCAAKDYEWFMGHRRAQMLVRIFGRTATRILYGILGLAMLVTGVHVFINGP